MRRRRPGVGGAAGRVDEQDVGGGEVGVAAVLGVGHVGAGEGGVEWGVLEPIGIWRADVDDGVVDVGTSAGADF